jgi:cytochrome c oxidase subunit IV
MTEEHGHGEHAGPSYRAYMVVAVVLAIFTTISFVVNHFVTAGVLAHTAGFALILGVAICKAFLVGAIFMHLRWEWGKLYYMIVPAFILGTMMMFVLLPDAVLGWIHEADMTPAVQAEMRRHHDGPAVQAEVPNHRQ